MLLLLGILALALAVLIVRLLTVGGCLRRVVVVALSLRMSVLALLLAVLLLGRLLAVGAVAAAVIIVATHGVRRRRL